MFGDNEDAPYTDARLELTYVSEELESDKIDETSKLGIKLNTDGETLDSIVILDEYCMIGIELFSFFSLDSIINND